MNKNSSIGCNVHQCRYHFKRDNYCSLPQIMVGTHETDPKVVQCTDCQSFEKENM